MKEITINNQPLKDYLEQAKIADPEAKITYHSDVVSMTSAAHTLRSSRATGRRAKKNAFYDSTAKHGATRRWTRSEIMLEELIRQATGVQLEILRTLDQDFKEKTFSTTDFIKAYRRRGFQSISAKSWTSFNKYLDNLWRSGVLRKLNKDGKNWAPKEYAYYKLADEEMLKEPAQERRQESQEKEQVIGGFVENLSIFMNQLGIAEIHLSIKMKE